MSLLFHKKVKKKKLSATLRIFQNQSNCVPNKINKNHFDEYKWYSKATLKDWANTLLQTAASLDISFSERRDKTVRDEDTVRKTKKKAVLRSYIPC